ncbi:alpha/beta hydrolase [Solimonas terrae]|uniref:Alpha/beta hydrolase n=1 Tax=Solimonas terrae TaxID=1396819 RepID=A0A6M2BTR8_9GAMM|nr:alpha/beta hydrolase [Solimonas terrae]NGY05858.1 alpha/beta hydrolase [Solimonas terrae]
MNTHTEKRETGVWSLLPDTISREARAIAEMFRHVPINRVAPTSTEEWRARNEAGKAFIASPLMQQMLNVKPAQSRRLTLDGAEHVLFHPPGYDAGRDPRLLVHIHGGGYVSGAPENEACSATPVVELLNCAVLSVRYPLWWEAPPGADVDRLVAIYRELRKERPASSIALMGNSAGGGLALRTTLRLHALGEALPAALLLATPWTDVTGAGDTNRTLVPYDILDTDSLDTVRKLVGSDEALRSAALSPIHARYPADFPPTIIATGTRDTLLSDCARLQRKLIDAGVTQELRVFEGMPHGFMGFRMPESDACMQDFCTFLDRYLK